MLRSRVLEARWLDWDVVGRPKVAYEKMRIAEKEIHPRIRPNGRKA
jgi:hypothetical protein